MAICLCEFKEATPSTLYAHMKAASVDREVDTPVLLTTSDPFLLRENRSFVVLLAEYNPKLFVSVLVACVPAAEFTLV